MSWLPERASGRDDFERTFGLRPDLFAAWREFAGIFWEKRLVDPVVLRVVLPDIRALGDLRQDLAAEGCRRLVEHGVEAGLDGVLAVAGE